MKKSLYFVLICTICLFALSGCKASVTTPEDDVELDTAKPIEPIVEEPTNSEIEDSVFELDASELTDDYLISLVLPLDMALRDENTFRFADTEELNETQLYVAFLLLADYAELEKYQDAEDDLFYFPLDVIVEHIEPYFKSFTFQGELYHNYDEATDCIVTATASGFGGDRNVKLLSKEISGNIVSFDLGYYEWFDNSYTAWKDDPYEIVTYSLAFYEGGYYYLSAVTK